MAEPFSCLFGVVDLVADDQGIAICHLQLPAQDVGAGGRVVISHTVPDLFVVARFAQFGNIGAPGGQRCDTDIFHQLGKSRQGVAALGIGDIQAGIDRRAARYRGALGGFGSGIETERQGEVIGHIICGRVIQLVGAEVAGRLAHLPYGNSSQDGKGKDQQGKPAGRAAGRFFLLYSLGFTAAVTEGGVVGQLGLAIGAVFGHGGDLLFVFRLQYIGKKGRMQGKGRHKKSLLKRADCFILIITIYANIP